MLPEAFTARMQNMLKEEYTEFEACYDKETYQALRFNPLKGEKKEFLANNPFSLTKVPWSENGYYYEKEDTPGKHPFHEAGVYYIQEPSAQAPATFLQAKPGERILDLCAAPGGKTTQIAADMKGEGLLICNEIHPARAKILSENVERMGIENAVVISENPVRLKDFFPGFFHRIMVDAPCSGEGMFRKNEDAHLEWSPENVEMCAERQDEILEAAATMLMPGGRIVYSTCTFAPAENEGSIARFLQAHPEFSVEEMPKPEQFCNGNWEYLSEEEKQTDHKEQIEKTFRLWPHKLNGEGHFLAVLKKDGDIVDKLPFSKNGVEKSISIKDCKEYQEFAKETIINPKYTDSQNAYLRFGDQLYLLPEGCPSMKGIKVLRQGLHLGTVKKNRFEPSHALALAMKKEDAKNVIHLSADSGQLKEYLKGNTFPAEGTKGWYLILAENYSIGWGKCAGGIMKNHYPKGLRK